MFFELIRVYLPELTEGRKAWDFIDEHIFVYFDPPYRPLTATASFASYTADCFTDDDQIALAKFVDEMAAKGAKVVVRKDNSYINIG